MSFLKRKFVRSVSIRLIGMLVISLAAIISSILTARLLGPSGKGVYFLLYSTLNMIIATGAIKLAFSQVYYRKHLTLAQMIGTSIVLSIIMGLVAASLGLFVVYQLRDSVYAEVPWEFILVAVSLVPVFLLATNLRSALDADYQIGSATIIMASRPVLFVLVFSGLALAGLQTVGAAVTAMTVSIIGMLLIAGVFILRTTAISLSDMKLHNKDMLGFAMRSHVGMIFRFMQDRFDVFIVAYFMTVSDVGLYSVALAISELAGKLSQVASTVLLGRLAKNTEEKKSIELTMRLNRILFFLTACSVIILAFLASFIINFAFGSEFAVAASAVIILLPGILAVSVFRVLNTNLISNGRPGLFSILTSSGVVVMIVGDFLLIPRYGIDGAALASTMAYLTSAVAITSVVVRNNHYKLWDYFNVLPEIRLVIARVRN